MTSLLGPPKIPTTGFKNDIGKIRDNFSDLNYLDSCCDICIFRRVRSEGEIFSSIFKPGVFQSQLFGVSYSAPNVGVKQEERFQELIRDYNYEANRCVEGVEDSSDEQQETESDEDDLKTPSRFDAMKRKNSFALNLNRSHKWRSGAKRSPVDADSDEYSLEDSGGGETIDRISGRINNKLDVQGHTYSMSDEGVKIVIEDERTKCDIKKRETKTKRLLKKQVEMAQEDRETNFERNGPTIKKRNERETAEEKDNFIKGCERSKDTQISNFQAAEEDANNNNTMVKVSRSFGSHDIFLDLLRLKAEATYGSNNDLNSFVSRKENVVPILKSDANILSPTLPNRQHRVRSKSSEYENYTGQKFERPPLLRRKSVHFADSRGLDLEIRHQFLLSDDCFLPPKLMEELRKSRACARANGCKHALPSANANTVKTSALSIRRAFGQPCEDANFAERIETMKVSLEKLTMSADSTTGTGSVVVENMEYNKNVFVRMSFNKWRSYLDVKTSYVPGCTISGSGNQLFDRFNFTFYVPHNFSGADNIEFAICYRLPSTGREYWDSNCNKNYVLKSLEYHHSTDNHDHFTLLT